MEGEPGAHGGPEADDLRVDALQQAQLRLERALAEAGASGSFRAIASEFQRAARDVQVALEQHRGAFEGAEGPLADFVQLKPGLQREAQQRRDDHLELLQRAAALEQAVERQLAFDSLDPEVLRTQAAILREELHLHVARARALAYEAYLVDEGGESG